ncbi:MAG TPA: protein-methionine-sulfoxide reductase heme-binding subunit MsrQ [Bordetella sp.]
MAAPALTVRTVGRIKPLLFIVGLLPFLRWLWLGWHDGLTANPVEFLTRSSGTWTLVCLLVTLGITPLRRLIGQPALVRLRRMCGLFAFFYALMHFLTWAWWDQDWVPSSMIEDVVRRPFITVGFTAFVLMSLLAVTSPQAAMRKLGRNWQRLHYAIYVIGLLAILHFWWMRSGKNNFEAPLIYGGVLLVLLGWRVLARLRRG